MIGLLERLRRPRGPQTATEAEDPAVVRARFEQKRRDDTFKMAKRIQREIEQAAAGGLRFLDLDTNLTDTWEDFVMTIVGVANVDERVANVQFHSFRQIEVAFISCAVGHALLTLRPAAP
ncbi:hypothetical protein A3A39_03305 [Candidatus Kaiserbacteria bacterium RIFCSPLOWO2_01_FULL_54_13]|uniref:Uncharacterized protein n=1 Tax=Candidatus Kaiserbacteria bacterium RIFCSPLOWO2_01_FULL_54_13 TaxID=1798512 RepID=A0A1F6F352_9BACT|nr:MAG: hypothetical protein A3A39_03305 [Candidatus Kaiserbacteria bacterium RIFCSPLOWO2_01_FULL_54_13]